MSKGNGGRNGNGYRMRPIDKELLSGAFEAGVHHFNAERDKLRGGVPAGQQEAFDQAVATLAEKLEKASPVEAMDLSRPGNGSGRGRE